MKEEEEEEEGRDCARKLGLCTHICSSFRGFFFCGGGVPVSWQLKSCLSPDPAGPSQTPTFLALLPARRESEVKCHSFKHNRVHFVACSSTSFFFG